MKIVDSTPIVNEIEMRTREADYQHEGEDWRSGLYIAMEVIQTAPEISMISQKDHELALEKARAEAIQEVFDSIDALRAECKTEHYHIPIATTFKTPKFLMGLDKLKAKYKKG